MILFNREFWLGNPTTSERGAIDLALITLAQTLIGLIGNEAVGIIELDWLGMLSVAGTAGAVAVLTHIVRKGSGAGTVVPEGNGRHRADEDDSE